MNPATIVVSGLPRSGTSLMMQMLAAGGVPLLADYHRMPDVFNPQGYWEYEPVKRIAKDSSWLKEAGGRAVKIVCPLVLVLPAGNYRVILMKRDLSAVAASQLKMLGRSHQESRALEELLAKSFSRVEKLLRQRTDLRLLTVDYHRILDLPGEVCQEVEDFLDPAIFPNFRLTAEKVPIRSFHGPK